ncbi:hypothetical protein OHA74_52270 [Streptomyces phaeochromogenes]|uniref:Uncharacterized protein n=1 Tax=Streptomyces phaeochromogenes TaxID=1923 RepID=A0ABZ1H0D6_STRPH|nr:hypothetical protein [Streptomyces phaeochromogenes]WSD11917.1 hypothetical protein OHB35_01100 [Streptomyces phaeochromogenes]
MWVTTPHIKQLEKLVRDGHLAAMPVIHDSWTGKANESLFKPCYEAIRKARTELVQVGGEPYKAYKTRLSRALRLLWPKRPAQRSPFWRPDWRMSMVADVQLEVGLAMAAGVHPEVRMWRASSRSVGRTRADADERRPGALSDAARDAAVSHAVPGAFMASVRYWWGQRRWLPPPLWRPQDWSSMRRPLSLRSVAVSERLSHT